MFAVNRNIGIFRQVFLAAVVGCLIAGPADAVTEPAVDYSPAELEELVGPVALYPDDLIAIILPASSYPLQIVQASRYLDAYETDPGLKPDDGWDDAIVALLNYPEVIALMNEDLDWTWNLGAAVVNQQADVLDAIQNFRGRAVAAGNLKTDEHQIVTEVDEVIEITPVEREVIYVPYYEPERVVVYQRYPVYHYYPYRYPLYYYPYPAHYSFASGFFWGVSTAYTIGWLTDRVHVHHVGYASHPYYGRHYAGHYDSPRAAAARHHRAARSRRHTVHDKHHYGNSWQPAPRHGNRPGHRRTATDHRRTTASNFTSSAFTSSARRPGSVRDPQVRSSGERQVRTHVRSGHDKKIVFARGTPNRARSVRSGAHRSTDTVRRNTRVASLDRSGNRNASRRTGERADARRRTARAVSPAQSTRATRTTPRGQSPTTAHHEKARAQPHQTHRAVQNTTRSTSAFRAEAKPGKASQTRVASAATGSRPGRARAKSRGGRSAGRARHRR
ncbi:MAG: DUF3300 domain-containing protein [Gammaproteobacteria bacterium]|nr:MAG: DUF3300 domain-containing protein [Gammaproteobacteria bacterium]